MPTAARIVLPGTVLINTLQLYQTTPHCDKYFVTLLCDFRWNSHTAQPLSKTIGCDALIFIQGEVKGT